MGYWPGDMLMRFGRRRGPVFRSRLGRTRYVYLLSPESNELVFAHDEWFSVHEAMKSLIPVDGETSVVVSDGVDHQRRRSVMRPALAPRTIESYLAAMRVSAVEAVEDLPGCGEVDVYPVFRRAIRRSTLRALFGPTMAEDADALGELLQPLLDLVDLLPQSIGVHQRLGTPRWRRARAAREELDRYIHHRIDEAFADAPVDPEDGGHGVLRLLVHGRDGSGSGLTRLEIRDQTVTLIAAGYETTSGAMGWAVNNLAHHPAWQDRARAEAVELLGGELTRARLEECVVLSAVLDETLRLYPPGVVLPRMVEQDFEVHGQRVRRGEMVLISPWVVQRDPRVHPRPLEFDPERWLSGLRPGPGSHLPFGGGAHRCIGAHMAVAELKVMLAHLLVARRFRASAPLPRARGFAALRPTHARIVVR